MNTPLVLPPLLELEIYKAEPNILSLWLIQAPHRLAAGVHDFCQPPSVQSIGTGLLISGRTLGLCTLLGLCAPFGFCTLLGHYLLSAHHLIYTHFLVSTHHLVSAHDLVCAHHLVCLSLKKYLKSKKGYFSIINKNLLALRKYCLFPKY